MTDASADRTGARLSGHSGITAETNANGSLRRFDCGSISLLLFVGKGELEGCGVTSIVANGGSMPYISRSESASARRRPRCQQRADAQVVRERERSRHRGGLILPLADCQRRPVSVLLAMPPRL